MNAARLTLLTVLLPLISSADGQRLYPDPFTRCEDPFIALRSADLTDTPDIARNQISIDLPERRLLRAPERIQIHGVNLDGYDVPAAFVDQHGETSNACTYKYVAEFNAFLLQECTSMQTGRPAAVHADTMELRVPGFEQLSRTTAWARFAGVQSNAGCGGRAPLNGHKFFNRQGAEPDRWFVVIDEALVSAGSVGTLASQLTQSVNGELDATYTAGPLAFAIKTSAANAQLLSQDNRVRFVENQPIFRGQGIRTVDSISQWGQDRIDQEEPRESVPPDHRLRWPDYENIQRPSVFVVDTAVLATHTAFAQLATSTWDPNPGLPSCSVTESGSAHGTNVASLMAGYYSSGQQAPIAVHFVKALGRRTDLLGTLYCDAGDGMTVANALQRVSTLMTPGDVVNLSLGSTTLSGFIEMQVEQLLRRGAVVVAAAGNENRQVYYPPANIPDVITVGGTKRDDGRWANTNYGPEVEVFAPAQNIMVASNASTTATAIETGTSLASPLVAGLTVHNVATSAWPPTGSIMVAKAQAERLVVDGVSHASDLLPVLRGRPLEKSPMVGITPLTPPGVSFERLAGSIGLWRGRSGSSTQFSLGRADVDGSGWPSATTVFSPLRQANEVCPALSGFDYGTYPGDSNYRAELLVGCYGADSPFVGLYTDSGEYISYRVEIDDAPLLAATFTESPGGEDANYGAVVGVMKRVGSGLFAFNRREAALLFTGKSIGEGTEVPVSRVTLEALPGHSFVLNDVAIRCDGQPSFHCTVWATATQWSESATNSYTVTVYRSEFDETFQSAPRVVQAPIIVLQSEMTVNASCGVPGLGIGYGARAVGVVPDDNGAGFSLVYTTSASDTLDGSCIRTGGTWVVRGPSTLSPPSPTSPARRLGEGIFANSMSYDRFNSTTAREVGRADRRDDARA